MTSSGRTLPASIHRIPVHLPLGAAPTCGSGAGSGAADGIGVGTGEGLSDGVAEAVGRGWTVGAVVGSGVDAGFADRVVTEVDGIGVASVDDAGGGVIG